MEEVGGRECEESRVKDRGSWRSNEMEGRCESDCRGNEVYPATFRNEEKTGLKLEQEENFKKPWAITLIDKLSPINVAVNFQCVNRSFFL